MDLCVMRHIRHAADEYDWVSIARGEGHLIKYELFKNVCVFRVYFTLVVMEW